MAMCVAGPFDSGAPPLNRVVVPTALTPLPICKPMGEFWPSEVGAHRLFGRVIQHVGKFNMAAFEGGRIDVRQIVGGVVD